jgi:hypothetical protein
VKTFSMLGMKVLRWTCVISWIGGRNMTGKEPLPPLENLTAAWLVLRIISPTPSLLPSAGGSEDGCGEGAQ